MEPKVTVLMPVYNGEKYLREAIDSVLSQTFSDFEFLIINDGSTDNSVEIIKNYNDSRIRLIHNDKNRGIVFSRNRGLEESRGEYIAILDCDDIAYPRRLEKQLKFLDAHPDFGVIGSWVKLIDSAGQPTGVIWKNRISPEKIPSFLLFGNCFAHSSTIIRAKAIPPELYQPFEISCDYDLWIRMSKKWKLWSLPEILTKYRVHQKGVSKSKQELLNQEIKKILIGQLANLKITPAAGELEIHRANYTYCANDLENFISRREAWLKELKKANRQVGYYSEPEFSQVISGRWFTSCSTNTRLGFWIWKKYWASDLSRTDQKNWLELLKFFIKCLLKKNNFN